MSNQYMFIVSDACSTAYFEERYQRQHSHYQGQNIYLYVQRMVMKCFISKSESLNLL